MCISYLLTFQLLQSLKVHQILATPLRVAQTPYVKREVVRDLVLVYPSISVTLTPDVDRSVLQIQTVIAVERVLITNALTRALELVD